MTDTPETPDFEEEGAAQDEDLPWISKEIIRQTEAAEERGDPLPILSGFMNAFFGKS